MVAILCSTTNDYSMLRPESVDKYIHSELDVVQQCTRALYIELVFGYQRAKLSSVPGGRLVLVIYV